MSTKTEHLGLHQWEPEDSFLRTDFNEDFARIDAGVKLLKDTLKGLYVTGSYTGTGPQGEDIKVSLGFKPTLLLVQTPNPGVGISMDGFSLIVSRNPNAGGNVISGGRINITEDGFGVVHSESYFNQKGTVYPYFALR